MPFLEDMSVGDRRAFGQYAVTREEILEFARRYDPQPFHLCDAAAARTHFGRLAASGWHTGAMMMAMNVAAMPDDDTRLGAAGVDELRWLRAVHAGDLLRCEEEILDLTPSRSRAEMGSARTRVTVFNQNNDAVMTFIAILLVRRRPVDGDATS